MRTQATPSGAQVQYEEVACDTIGPPHLPNNVTVAGLAWSWSDNGQGWIGTAVSLGMEGTQVFTETHKNAMSANLLSSFDTSPPTPIWDNPAPQTEARKVASAETTDLHVAIHEIVLGTQRRAEVVARSSSAALPLWSYAFDPLITTGSDVGISRDGSRVVAAISRDEVNEVDIAVLNPATGAELSYTSIGVTGPLHGFDLSADGSTLLFTADTFAYLFDVASATVVFSTDIGTGLDAAAISGDGRVLAFGGYNWMRVWEKNATTWASTYTRYVPGLNYVSAIDVSDDGSTIAYGFTFYDAFLTIRVEALDVASKTVTMTDIAIGTGALQNMVSDVAISADGSRFAVATWGEASGFVDELRYYSRSSSSPLASIDLPGSAFDVAISADGRRVAAASKAVHANTLGLGGSVSLYDAGGADLALIGAPKQGTTPVFELYGQPGRIAWLLVAETAANPPFHAYGGTLYLDREHLQAFPMGLVSSSGVADLPFTFSTAPGLLGATLYFQGLSSPPLRLTKDSLAVTVLP